MTEGERGLTIEALAERVGVPVRTVRYYITEGLLPGPGARGRGASYGREHLLRLRLIRRLAERRVPIAEIRDTVAKLSTPDVAALLAEEDPRAAELQRTSPATAPKAYVAALLTRSRTASGGGTAPPSAARQTWWREWASAQRAAPHAPHGDPPAAPAAQAPPATPAPPASAAVTWQRTELAPGVELHVRADAAARQRDLLARLRAAAGVHGGASADRPPDTDRPDEQDQSHDESRSGDGTVPDTGGEKG